MGPKTLKMCDLIFHAKKRPNTSTKKIIAYPPTNTTIMCTINRQAKNVHHAFKTHFQPQKEPKAFKIYTLKKKCTRKMCDIISHGKMGPDT